MKTIFTLIRFTFMVLVLLLLVLPEELQAQTSHNVDVTNNVYTPKNLKINVGDTVVWENKQGFHNVNGTTGTYPSNPESFGNSTGRNWTFSHVFTTSGNYDYQCDPHVSLGMVGTVEVSATTSVDELLAENASVLVFPNPARDKIRITSENTLNKNWSVEVYSLSGSLVQTTRMENPGTSFEMDISKLNKGSYFLRLKNSTDVEIVRFVKQ